MAEDSAAREQERASADPAAMILALGGQEEARDYLRKQSRLADLQIEDAERQDRLRHWSLRFGNISAVMKVAFEVALAFIVLAIAAFIATGMWTAAHDKGLVIEAFSVPPDFAQRGLSGEVVASQLLDKLARMQEQTNSIRPANSYRNNWGDDVKVEIPDTGISIGELNRYLRRWLGDETHITGEIYHAPSGIAVTARAGGAGQTLSGRDTEFDALLQKTAESIYSQTQPYRYAAFLKDAGRDREAMGVLERLAANAAPAERAWALSFLGTLYMAYKGPDAGLATLWAGVQADPTNGHTWDNLSSGEMNLDREEDVYRHMRKALQLYDSGNVPFNSGEIAIVKLQDRAQLAFLLGDYQTASGADESIRQLPDSGNSRDGSILDETLENALNHNVPRARNLLAQIHPSGHGEDLDIWFRTVLVSYFAHDWRALARLTDHPQVGLNAPGPLYSMFELIRHRIPVSLDAEARAEQDDIAGAWKRIATTPLDCYTCVLLRGQIDAGAHNWGGAAYWFARAVHEGPSLPLAYAYWGEMLLHKGDYDGAITKFREANVKGSHYADPLEMWGEALMRKTRSDLALVKFGEANKYAPNWGRLHLKWGEALLYAGEKGDAKKQFATASHLSLSATESAELSHVRAPHA